MTKNKFCATFSCALLCFIALPLEGLTLPYDQQAYAYTLPPITLLMDNSLIETPQLPPIQLGNTTLVPIKEILDALGASFEWKNYEKKIYIYYADTLIVLEIDQPEAWINGEIVPLQAPAKMINNKVMVPLRFLTEQLNYQVTHYPIIKLSKMGRLRLEHLTFEDAYRERQLVINFNGQYELLYDDGMQSIQDGFIEYLQVVTTDTTKLIIQESKVQAYNAWEDEAYIYIELVPPTEKYGQIIFLDPGHGGAHPGSVANGITEKDLNLKQALAVQALIEQDGLIKVYMSREDDTIHFKDVEEELLYRTQLANEIGAHYFISMHNNASASHASGTETFYYADDTTALHLASLIQSQIVTNCQTVDRSVKPNKELLVLLASDMPAILIETGFITNQSEALSLKSDTFNDRLAHAIYSGILEMFH